MMFETGSFCALGKSFLLNKKPPAEAGGFLSSLSWLRFLNLGLRNSGIEQDARTEGC